MKGLQSGGVGATPKHFVGKCRQPGCHCLSSWLISSKANDQETKRFKYNAKVPTRALREVYLLPFQMVVREADPWCMMTAYNRVNGHYCDTSKELLIDIARGEWGWDGLFMSDWGGTTSTVESINNGLDLEMPGPPSKRSLEALDQPIRDGKVDLDRVSQSAGRLLRLLKKAGRFSDARDDPEVCIDNPDKRALLLRAASEGIVMLKNENNALPIPSTESLGNLAILGPNAERIVAGGGGSSYIKAPYWTSIQGSLREAFRNTNTQIHTAEGAKVNRYLPVCMIAKDPETGVSGAAVDWYNTHDWTSSPVVTTHM